MNKISRAGKKWGNFYKDNNLEWVNKKKKNLKYYEDLYNSEYGKSLRRCINFIDKNENIKILEAGCGVGEMAVCLSRFYDIKGFDYNQEALNICNELNNVLDNKVNFYVDDLLKLRIDNEIYNFIYNQAVIEYFNHEEKNIIIKNIKKILSKNGILFLVCQNTNSLRSKKEFINQPNVYDCNPEIIKKLLIDNDFEILFSDWLYTSKVFAKFLSTKFMNNKIKYYIWRIIDLIHFPYFIRKKYHYQFAICARNLNCL